MDFKQDKDDPSKDVDPRYLSAPAWYGLWQADKLHKEQTGTEATCTSTGDTKHSVKRSRHYTGEFGFGFCNAWDLRIWAFRSQSSRERFTHLLSEKLGPDWVVVLESDHIHAHWGPVFREHQG